MISNKIHFTVKNNEKDYVFICDADSPLGVIHDVLCQFKGVIVQKINEVEEAEKPKWSRPGHKIERNELAKQKAKAEKKDFEPRKVSSVDKI